jgi:hypothetical protein
MKKPTKITINYYLDKRNHPRVAIDHPLFKNNTPLYPLYIRLIYLQKVTRFQSKFFLFESNSRFSNNFVSEAFFNTLVEPSLANSRADSFNQEIEHLHAILTSVAPDNFSVSNFSYTYNLSLTDFKSIFQGGFNLMIDEKVESFLSKESSQNIKIISELLEEVFCKDYVLNFIRNTSPPSIQISNLMYLVKTSCSYCPTFSKELSELLKPLKNIELTDFSSRGHRISILNLNQYPTIPNGEITPYINQYAKNLIDDLKFNLSQTLTTQA